MTKRFNPQRRQLLKVGLLGSTLLAVAGSGVAVSRQSQPCADCFWMQQEDWLLFQAIVPVMLAGALPADTVQRASAIKEIISGVDFTVAHFPPAVRDEIRQLLWLLQSSFTRPLLTGLWADWTHASVADIHYFLESWRISQLDLLRVGYSALHDLIVGAWYANPLAWKRIRYPGPPSLT